MARTIRKCDYHCVILDDGVGTTRGIVKALCGKGIRLLAFSSFPFGKGRTQLDVVTEDPDALARVLAELGLSVSTKKSGFLIHAGGEPCALAEVLAQLDRADVPITSVQAIATGMDQCAALLWTRPEDVSKAAAVLNSDETYSDTVDEASEESFPASDSPAWVF